MCCEDKGKAVRTGVPAVSASGASTLGDGAFQSVTSKEEERFQNLTEVCRAGV